MKYRVNIFGIFLMLFVHAKSQLLFNNPSFEGENPTCSFSVPDKWTVCDYHVDLIGDSIKIVCSSLPPWLPSKSISGNVFVAMGSRKPNINGTIAQKLNCHLNSGVLYRFNLFAASLWGPQDSIWAQGVLPGYLKIYIGRDSCDKKQLIYKSETLDSAWRRLQVTFTADSNFDWISITAGRDSINYTSIIVLDTISPIHLINANAVHVANKDTVVYTQPNEQKCISVKATSTITTYDTVRWYKLLDTVKVPVAVGLQASVCVDSNTTFLIGLRDSVIGCAGVEWSWDTLRVWVRDTVLGVREVDVVHAFSLQPNPVVDVLTITPSFEGPYDWTITDALGRLSAKGRGRNTTEVPLEGLSRGAYLLQVEGVVRRFLKE